MTASAALLLAAAGCRGRADSDGAAKSAPATVAEALRPSFLAAALRRVGGAHLHATSRFAAGPGGGAQPDAVTTTTDVWLDRQGNYRFTELNDRDGGREVVHTGRDLAVALRYGKMIRRAAEEPEPTRLLEEALGAPWAAWEVVAPVAAIEPARTELRGGAKATAYKLALAAGTAGAKVNATTAAGAQRPGPLQAWRSTVSVESLAGRVVIDDATGAVMQADLQAGFALTQEGRPLKGELEVHEALSDVASTPAVERPAAEDLALRQRIVPEQKELLSGLPSTRGDDGPARAKKPRRDAKKPEAAKPDAAKPDAKKPAVKAVPHE
jgi:hypothetical protein